MLSVAIGLLYYQQPDGSRLYLMQLRDDIPTILSPGKWGFFGGSIENGETPIEAAQRELTEEISATAELIFWKRQDLPHVVRHIFAGTPRIPFSKLKLLEGMDMGLFTPDDILRGRLRAPVKQIEREIIPAAIEILSEYFDWLKA
jgi:8-oxo-dGTP diphosphatase